MGLTVPADSAFLLDGRLTANVFEEMKSPLRAGTYIPAFPPFFHNML